MSDTLPEYGALGQQLAGHAATLGHPAPPTLGQPGVVPVQLNGLLPASDSAQTVPFEAAAPGSKIAVFAPGFAPGERCTVIKMESEWGTTSVPALHLIDTQGERRILPSTIQGARIEILVSAEQLGIERAPEDAIRVRTKPIDAIAMQWKGGPGEAAKFILWATGRAVLQYGEETGSEDEYLLIQKLDQTAGDYMRPGDWLVKSPDGDFRVVLQADFRREFEEVSFVG